MKIDERIDNMEDRLRLVEQSIIAIGETTNWLKVLIVAIGLSVGIDMGALI